jgi:hypothetical protein
MLRKLQNGDVYNGRYPGIVPMNVALDREAALILEALAPHKRARGQFISRLLHDYQARLEEREQLRREVQQGLEKAFEGAATVG